MTRFASRLPTAAGRPGAVLRPLRLVGLAALLFGCARAGAPPLPGDSVSQDGAVAVAPPRAPSIAPATEKAASRDARDVPPRGVIESRLFPAEVVMEHQVALGLDDKQRALIMGEVERAQSQMNKVRWDLERQRETLAKLLDAEPVDEIAALAVAKRLTDHEASIKAANLAMLLRVKNALTAAQKAKLATLR